MLQTCDIAINWAGGLHHAKKCEVSAFSDKYSWIATCTCSLVLTAALIV